MTPPCPKGLLQQDLLLELVESCSECRYARVKRLAERPKLGLQPRPAAASSDMVVGVFKASLSLEVIVLVTLS
jgi:hypothetical protein